MSLTTYPSDNQYWWMTAPSVLRVTCYVPRKCWFELMKVISLWDCQGNWGLSKKKTLTASVFSISMHAFHSIIYISFFIFTDIFEIVLNILEQMARGRTVPERSSMKWFDYLDYTASCLQIKFMIIKILYKIII